MRILATFLLLSTPLAAQTLPPVLTCASAAAGIPMSPWPNCSATAYKPAAAGLVVATMRAGKAIWEPSASIVATDSVFTNVAYNNTTSNWWPSTKFTWGVVTPPPATTLPAAVTGITISWTAPAPIVGATLAGFRIYEGTAVLTVSNPAATSYMLPILPAGKYPISLTSFTTTGAESARTAPLVITIPTGTQPVVQSNTVTCNSGT